MSLWETVQCADASDWIRGLSLGAAGFLVLGGFQRRT